MFANEKIMGLLLSFSKSIEVDKTKSAKKRAKIEIKRWPDKRKIAYGLTKSVYARIGKEKISKSHMIVMTKQCKNVYIKNFTPS